MKAVPAQMRSNITEIDNMDDAQRRQEDIQQTVVNELHRQDLLGALGNYDDPIHFDDWFYGGDQQPVPRWQLQMEKNKNFNPEKNYHDMVAQETWNVDKEVFAINGLEAKVQNTNNASNEMDREMLAGMKKELGMEVGFQAPSEIKE